MKSGAVAGAINVVAGIASRVETGIKTVSIFMSEEASAGLATIGIDVAGDFAAGFIAGVLGDFALLLLFDVTHEPLGISR